MELRKATISDFEVLYRLRCEDNNIRWTGHIEAPSKDGLREWYAKALSNPTRDIYLYWYNDDCLGYLYVDVVNDDEREIAYGISEKQQGKGYASSMICDCIRLLREAGIKSIRAAISDFNAASEHVATKNGFYKTEEYYYSELPLICGKSKFYIWKRNI